MVALPSPPGRPPVGGDAGGEALPLLPGAASTVAAPGFPSAALSPAASGAPAAGAASAAPAVGAWLAISAHAVEVLERAGHDTIPHRIRAIQMIVERSRALDDPSDADLMQVVAGVLLELALEVQIAAVEVPYE